jgi:2-dehydro-3-deoxyglucarate aldolase/4-hydroxy-2-oxoheptanedioate aldolase
MTLNTIELKAKWKRGEPSPGLWMRLADPTIGEIVRLIGLDWVAFDSEHSALDLQTLQMMLIALGDTPTLIRVPGNDPVHIKRILDMGAAGVIVPQVQTAAEVRQAVAACKYPPEGIRGTGPRRPSNYGDNERDYLANANKQTIACVMIEMVGAVEDIDNILAVPGLDAIFIGAVDLSASMGLLPHYDDPRVTAAIDKVIAKAKAAGVARASGRPPAPDDLDGPWSAAGFLRQGLHIIPVASDENLIKDGARAALRTFMQASVAAER